jgi:hypothetical protein
MKVGQAKLKRHQFGLGSLVWVVIVAAGLFAVFRVDYWAGWTVCTPLIGLWLGRRLGKRFASDPLWGRLAGGVIGVAIAFPLAFVGQMLLRRPVFPAAWNDLPLPIAGGAVYGLLIGVGTEVLVRALRERRYRRIQKSRSETERVRLLAG